MKSFTVSLPHGSQFQPDSIPRQSAGCQSCQLQLKQALEFYYAHTHTHTHTNSHTFTHTHTQHTTTHTAPHNTHTHTHTHTHIHIHTHTQTSTPYRCSDYKHTLCEWPPIDYLQMLRL